MPTLENRPLGIIHLTSQQLGISNQAVNMNARTRIDDCVIEAMNNNPSPDDYACYNTTVPMALERCND